MKEYIITSKKLKDLCDIYNGGIPSKLSVAQG